MLKIVTSLSLALLVYNLTFEAQKTEFSGWWAAEPAYETRWLMANRQNDDIRVVELSNALLPDWEYSNVDEFVEASIVAGALVVSVFALVNFLKFSQFPVW